jgi:plastocyanin
VLRIPKAALFVPLLAIGIFLPGFSSALPTASSNQIGMTQEEFTEKTVTISAGSRLTFVNNSHFLHLLAPGKDAMMSTQQGIPAFDDSYGTHVSEAGDQYVTTAWNTLGTYHLTCTLHPEMTLTVVVRAK